jgi:hypothetical protein
VQSSVSKVQAGQWLQAINTTRRSLAHLSIWFAVACLLIHRFCASRLARRRCAPELDVVAIDRQPAESEIQGADDMRKIQERWAINRTCLPFCDGLCVLHSGDMHSMLGQSFACGSHGMGAVDRHSSLLKLLCNVALLCN